MNFNKIAWTAFSLFIFSCANTSTENDISSRVAYIESIVKEHGRFLSRVKIDTTTVGNNTYYTSYNFDNRKNLQSIIITEPAESLKYVSHFHNDSLLKVSVESRDVNYTSDEAAAYYLTGDSIIYRKEPRGKLENLGKLIADQKKNADKFNNEYKPLIVL